MTSPAQNLQPVALRPPTSSPIPDARKGLYRLHWYIQPLRRWSILILLVAMACGSLAYLYESKVVKPTYQAGSVIEVDYPAPSATPGSGGSDFVDSQLYAASTAPHLIHNIQVSTAALKLLDRYLAGEYVKPKSFPQVTELYHWLGAPTPAQRAALQKLLPVGPFLGGIPNPDLQRKAQHLLTISQATPIANGNGDTIWVTGENPFVAALVSNALAVASSGYQSSVQASASSTALANIQAAIMSNQKLLKAARQHKQFNLARSLVNTITNEQTNYASIAANASLSAIKILVSVPASVPLSPVGPHPLRTAAIAGIIALLVLAGGLVMREYFSTTLRTPEEVSEAVGGAPVLGAILRQGSSKSPSASLTADPRSATAEGLRVIRTNLLFSTVDREPHIILLTSARQAEGKTTISSNLAASMAELGSRVLIIDADLRRPSLGRVFGVDTRTGLTNALVAAGNEPLDGFIKKVEGFHGLAIMPSGPIPPNPAELLSSGRMRDLLQRLGSVYDTIIIDSPPLLAVADPAILATMADAVILVLDVDQATLQSAGRTREALEQVGSHISGVVLNKLTDNQRGGYYYNYYYRHEYGYGYGPEAEGKSGAKSK